MADETKNQDTKEKLIKEKIIGRRLTWNRILRLAGSAAICGAVFGLVASLTFCGFNAVNQSAEKEAKAKEESEAESRAYEESIAESEAEAARLAEEEAARKTREALAESEAESIAAAYPQETENASEDGQTEAETESSAASGEGMKASEERQTKVLYEGFKAMRKEAVETISSYLVKVNVVSTETTWFENTAESTETYSGVILDVSPKEILILTTLGAAASEKRRVVFANGVSLDAYIKQTSVRDGLAVLAVSPEDGIGEEMLKNLKHVEYAEQKAVCSGEPMIAAGSPIGTAGSYTFGDVDYVQDHEMGVDSDQAVFYADFAADAERGTFVFDYEGKITGIAAPANAEAAAAFSSTRVVGIGTLSDTLDRLKSGKKSAYAGITGADVDFSMRYSGIPEGMYVTDVENDSPAYNIAIRRGDIITEVNGKKITDAAGYADAVRVCAPGDEIRMKAQRASSKESYSELEFSFTLGER